MRTAHASTLFRLVCSLACVRVCSLAFRLVCSLAFLLVCSLASAQTPAVESLTPSDFAYGRAITLPEGGEPIVSVEVPLDVYRAMHSGDLSELMVFNGRGAQVPHAIRRVTEGPASEPEVISLPLFPLTLAATQRARGSELALEVERDAAGQVVRLAARSDESAHGPRVKPRSGVHAPAPASPLQPIAAYVLDARSASRAIVNLRIALAESSDDRVLPLRIEASDDLVTFEPVAVDGVLIQLGHGGQRIDRDRLELPQTRAQFYRLSPARAPSFPTAIIAVQATLAAAVTPKPFVKVAVSASTTPKPQVFRFDLGGPVPVDRIDVELPEQNTVVNAELFASASVAGPFQRIARTRLYRTLQNGMEVRTPALEIARRTDRFYELRVEATGGGLGSGRPVLVTQHTPDQLLFMRRGEGPFTLAYGRYRTPHARFEAEDLLLLSSNEPAPTSSATLGPPKSLGGPERLVPPKAPPPYKTYIVWAVLIAGVMLLAGLALHLARSGQQRS